MKLTHLLPIALCAFASTAFAAEKTYQVTGPVVEVTDTKIIVTSIKTKENFEMARNAGTKVTGDVKVGSKVTVQYSITATEIESKDAPKKDDKKAEPAKKEDKKAEPKKK